MSSITLGPGPEIVPLSTFVQFGLTAIYEANSLDAFSAAFDSLFAQKLKSITFNGQKLTRDQYKSKFRVGGPFADAASSVTYGDIVIDSSDNIIGLAGVIYTATFKIQPGLVVGPPPTKRVQQSSLTVSVKEDSSISGVGDKRKVVSVDQVQVQVTNGSASVFDGTTSSDSRDPHQVAYGAM